MLDNWFKRHQDKRSLVLHIIGIPLTIIAIPFVIIGIIKGEVVWYLWAVIFIIVGYGLQFLGHWFEGNDAGEIIIIKKILGRPYVDIAPQYKEDEK